MWTSHKDDAYYRIFGLSGGKKLTFWSEFNTNLRGGHFFCHNETIQVLLYVGYESAFQIGLTGV